MPGAPGEGARTNGGEGWPPFVVRSIQTAPPVASSGCRNRESADYDAGQRLSRMRYNTPPTQTYLISV
jgi:hypothetical protein